MTFLLRILTVGLCLALPISTVSAATVLVMGDSLSAGYGIKKEAGWVALLAQQLQPQHKIINASISGNTIKDGQTRLAAALKQHQPDVVIIALGGNDALRGLPLTQMQTNLSQMVKQSKAAKAKVLLVGMDMPPNFGNAYRKQFNGVYQTVAKDTQTPLLPLLVAGFETDMKAFQADGIHPNASKQKVMMNNVLKPLRPLLR